MRRMRPSLSLLYVLAAALMGAVQTGCAEDAPRAASFAYVANDRAGTVSAFHIDAATGALTLLASTAPATDKNPYSITVDPGGHWLYVAHGDASSMVAFSIDPIGGGLKAAPISRT